MPQQLKAGVIGLGILGSQHASFLHDHEAVDLVAVTDLRPEVADRVATSTGAEAFTDLHAMLKSHALDLAVVATPDPLHREPTLAVLDAAVPAILLEKPMATTLEDAIAIYNAVERHEASLFINFANRASPTFKASRYVIQGGLLGEVVYGEARLDDNICVPTEMWAQRSKNWAAGSSTVHFLLSHVVDLMRWFFSPAEVKQVYAISQTEVLGSTPDLYDAFLSFDSGLKLRIKAEWIKHIDELVEFYLCFSGNSGTLIHNKRPGFAAQEGWRVNLAADCKFSNVERHQDTLAQKLGVNVDALRRRPQPEAGDLAAGSGKQIPALESRRSGETGTMGLAGPVVDAILNGTREPVSWAGNGDLPNHIDGLKQTQVCVAIAESADKGQPVDIM